MNGKYKFLKSNSNISVEYLMNILKSYKSLAQTTEDRKIAGQIYDEIKRTNELPEWWTPQESFYLEGLKDQENAGRYIIFRYKCRIFTRDRITPDFPIYVLIEPTSVCNLRCPFCFQSDRSFTKKQYMGFMDIDLYTRVIDECEANGTGAITLASRGEPTMHPRLPDMLKYLENKFFEVKLNTNGTRLTEELCHDIFRSGVNDIVLSIDTEQ